jgi:protein-arginine kinase activator protein McsA
VENESHTFSSYAFLFLKRSFITLIEFPPFTFTFSQAGKVIERAEERGWFCQERDWSGSPRSDAIDAKEHQSVTQASVDSDASLFHIADESRSKCAICGMLFKMILTMTMVNGCIQIVVKWKC